jgi:hypothetical protein
MKPERIFVFSSSFSLYFMLWLYILAQQRLCSYSLTNSFSIPEKKKITHKNFVDVENFYQNIKMLKKDRGERREEE